ncbi:glycosyl transferase [Bacteroidia bacterium]|nr:glycosyl transferase [Bacteroidia bacterium]
MHCLAPVVLFVYNRLDCLTSTINALKNNFAAADSNLFIFSDAPKSEQDNNKVNQVRSYIKTIQGFKKITIVEREQNFGLAKSIIEGVTETINQYGKVIVLEDDLITSPNFLSYMNSALNYYERNQKIFSIAGYTHPIKNPKQDVYFTQRASSWGWATWKNRWENVRWDLKEEYILFMQDKIRQKQFNRMGSDLCKMLDRQMNGKINSWAIRWCYNQFLTQQYTVYPTLSKVINAGTDGSATHTQDRFNRLATPIDQSGQVDFRFPEEILLDDFYLKQFLKNYSLLTRIKYRLLNACCP